MSIDKELINEYFNKHWPVGNDSYQHSNIKSILDKIPEEDTVIDIGCGYNPFKPYLKERLYAIDPAIDCGDELVDIESFNSKGRTWDVALCLGSINFGDEEVIKSQIKKTVSLLSHAGLIIWRQNPGVADHNNEECKTVPFFNWTIEKNYQYAEENGCEVILCTEEYNDKGNMRIYAEWVKR